jgi:hypothetical protein
MNLSASLMPAKHWQKAGCTAATPAEINSFRKLTGLYWPAMHEKFVAKQHGSVVVNPNKFSDLAVFVGWQKKFAHRNKFT